MISYYMEGSDFVAVETGQPVDAVRVGVGSTAEEAREALASTAIQSTGRDCGERAGLKWAEGAGWISSASDLEEVEVDEEEESLKIEEIDGDEWLILTGTDIPEAVRFMVRAEDQGQIVECAYGNYDGDRYMRITDRSERPGAQVSYRMLLGGAERFEIKAEQEQRWTAADAYIDTLDGDWADSLGHTIEVPVGEGDLEQWTHPICERHEVDGPCPDGTDEDAWVRLTRYYRDAISAEESLIAELRDAVAANRMGRTAASEQHLRDAKRIEDEYGDSPSVDRVAELLRVKL